MRAAILAVALSGCLATVHGSAQPSLAICNAGSFDQKLVLAKDFRIDRSGDDGYDSDAEVRTALAADMQRVEVRGVCPGKRKLGTFEMTLRRIEVGSSRSAVGKILTWAVLILPTLGFSSIYPLSETRWLTVELDATATVDGNAVWSGAFTSHIKYGVVAKELPSTGEVLTTLMKRAQDSAVADLVAAVRTESRIQ